jgi:hypothetical protein
MKENICIILLSISIILATINDNKQDAQIKRLEVANKIYQSRIELLEISTSAPWTKDIKTIKEMDMNTLITKELDKDNE